jgi:predicted neutral ceramidase superfamily lipid hydrolase
MLILNVIAKKFARNVMPNMMTNNELTVEIERIKGDIRLIHKSIETIEKNHLRHIEDDVSAIKKVLWTVAVIAGTQMIIVIRELMLRGL